MAGSLGHLAATVSLNIDPFKQSSAALMSTIKNTNTALKLQDNYVKAYGNALNSMRTHYSTLSQQMSNYNARLKEQEATYQKLNSQTAKTADEQEKLTRRQQNAASQINRTKSAMNQLDSEMGRLGRQIAQQETSWYKAANNLKKFSSAATSAGQKMSSMGSTMTTRVTAPIVAGFGYAAKSAIDFNSQIKNIGPLLQANGESAGQVRREMTQMANASKKWSVQYGISTKSINTGLEELVKRGYSANQAMGAMPSILNAAKASGDDFNSVMTVSTSTLEQFGLKSKTTAGMLKNTQRVTDSLTYTANATAAGFQDMGDAMTYVGPTAHAAGISLEETAAAIGLMSNQGIEGSVAGTALRSALTRLMKPSKQNAAGFKELGINVADFKKGTLTLPEILNKIKTNTAGWTKEQRAAAIATAFGTEAQAGMNALVSEGGDALTELTEKTEKATGSTKKIADTMNSTKAAQLAQFKESLHVLAITIGDQLTPTLMPLVKDATQVVKAFGRLDESTQQTIVKTAAFAAAIGPLLSILGGATRGLGALSGAFVAPLLGMSRMVGASKQGATGLGILKAGFSKTAYESGNFATKTGTAAAGVASAGERVAGTANTYTTFGSKVKAAGSSILTFAAANPVATGAILVTTAALVAGGVWWETYGKKAYQSSQRVSRWGSDVGASADKSLSKVQGFNVQASQALDSFGDSATANGKTAAKAFEGIGKEIDETGKKINKDLGKGLDNLPPQVRATVEKSVNEQRQGNNKIVSQSKTLSSDVSGILRTHNGDVRKLTAEQQTYIRNSQQKLNDNEIKLLGITGKKKVAVMKALNGTVKGLTEQQAQQTIDSLEKVSIKEESSYKKQANALKSYRNKGLITEKAYTKAMDQLQTGHKSQLTKNLSAIDKLENDYSARHSTSLEKLMQDEKISWNDVDKTLSKAQSNGKTKLSAIAQEYGKVGTVAKTAGEDWNHMVLDPKTGKIKTNAQETINDTAKTQQGWAQLKFDLKNAKINSNAKSMIGEAAIQSGRWDSLPWKDKKAMIRVQGNKELTGVVKQVKDWDKLTPQQKTAIVRAKGQKELALAMIDAGEWNNLSMKDKEALVKTSGEKDMIDLLTKAGDWDKLSIGAKQAVIEGKGNAELVDELNNLGEWNNLTPEQKSLVINNKATAPIVDAMIKSGAWNTLTLKQQDAIIHDKATAKLVLAMQQSGIWNQLTLREQNAVVNDKATGNMINALASTGKWQGLDIGAKNAIVNDNASAPIIAALVQSGQWNGLPLNEKTAIINTGNSAMDLANLVISYGNFDALSDSQKNLIIHDQSAMTALREAGYGLQSYNLKPAQLKQLKAENKDVISKTKVGQTAVVHFNGQSVEIKKMEGNNIDVLGKITTAKTALNQHNAKKVKTKNFKGNNVELLNKSQTAQTSLHNFNGINPIPKILQSKDNASGPARRAKRGVDAFPIGTKVMNLVTNSIHNFISHFTKKEKGDTDFTEGTAMVNDQRGPVFREMIKLPNGDTFVPQGRNVIMALPRHTQIIPARQTNKLLGGIPQYANGTPGYSSVVKDFTELSPSLTNQTTQYFNSSNPVNNSPVNNHNEYTINIQAAVSSDTDIRKLADKVMREIKRKDDRNILAQGGGVNY
ncbi:phage tail tape measure protein [Companilactobacillus farciminis]|uniref:phage tail tape measure protein n=1 Tax=Companilactobacillus farciminis TaxID=1612 RepID=UPI00232EB195|nr:phage tail tape measure protein [Companilactobacillus farciminis]WCG36415.1 phage tail tape measure protein [Companilactobacillus farciminis]